MIAPKGPAPSSGALRIDTYSGTQVSGRRLTNTTGYQLPFEEEIGVLTEVRYLQEDAGSQMFLTEELMIKYATTGMLPCSSTFRSCAQGSIH
ncbi:MAG: hypothetical protein IPN20_00280 [Haliscomenobacter sp.]|nr:hypothetical protein [Haliscomenobacter sp.]